MCVCACVGVDVIETGCGECNGVPLHGGLSEPRCVAHSVRTLLFEDSARVGLRSRRVSSLPVGDVSTNDASLVTADVFHSDSLSRGEGSVDRMPVC